MTTGKEALGRLDNHAPRLDDLERQVAALIAWKPKAIGRLEDLAGRITRLNDGACSLDEELGVVADNLENVFERVCDLEEAKPAARRGANMEYDTLYAAYSEVLDELFSAKAKAAKDADTILALQAENARLRQRIKALED